MSCVYLIRLKTTFYIGSTKTSLSARLRVHRCKYKGHPEWQGVTIADVNILETVDHATRYELQMKEQEWITKYGLDKLFNTRNARVRQSLLKRPNQIRGRPVIADGIEYKSVKEAAEKLGVDGKVIRYRIKKGVDGYRYNGELQWHSID